MKVLADESVDGQIVERLRRDGHDVVYSLKKNQELQTPKFFSAQMTFLLYY